MFLTIIMHLSYKEKVSIYNSIMESVAPMIQNLLLELSQETVDSAARKATQRNLELLQFVGPDGVSGGNMGGGYKIDPAKFKTYIARVDNPKRKERLIKMYKDGTLGDYLLRQKHYFSTIALNKIEWFRDNTDISLSPEFYEGTYSTGSERPTRKPTRDEHDFYRYFSSMGQDTEGMSKKDIKRYRDAFCRFYEQTQGVDGIWDMVPEVV